MIDLSKHINPLDPFSIGFTYPSLSRNLTAARSRSLSDLRHIERPSDFPNQDGFCTSPSSLPKSRLVARSSPTSVKYNKAGTREIGKSVAHMKASEQSEGSEDVKEGGSVEKDSKYVINLTNQGNKNEGRGNIERDQRYVMNSTDPGSIVARGGVDERNNMRYITDLTADHDSSEDTIRTCMTINEFFLAERRKDLAAIAESKLLKEQKTERQAERQPDSIKETIQRRATRAKVWLTPTKAVIAGSRLFTQHPLQLLRDPESQNVSITTINTSILFPPSPTPRISSPPSILITKPSSSVMQTADPRKVPFPPQTATRFEIQDWLHALFRAHKTPSLPPFSLYQLDYTGQDLHRMATESTPDAADLTREFVGGILKTGGVSVKQAEIVHWEILSFGEESVEDKREGRELGRMGSLATGRRSLNLRRSSSSARRRSECADQERRVKMGPYVKDTVLSPELLVGDSDAGATIGDGEKDEKTGMSVRRRVKKLFKGLVGWRLSVKVEFKPVGKAEL